MISCYRPDLVATPHKIFDTAILYTTSIYYMSLLYIFVPTECVPAKTADAIHFVTREGRRSPLGCQMELLRDREPRATTHSPFHPHTTI